MGNGKKKFWEKKEKEEIPHIGTKVVDYGYGSVPKGTFYQEGEGKEPGSSVNPYIGKESYEYIRNVGGKKQYVRKGESNIFQKSSPWIKNIGVGPPDINYPTGEGWARKSPLSPEGNPEGYDDAGIQKKKKMEIVHDKLNNDKSLLENTRESNFDEYYKEYKTRAKEDFKKFQEKSKGGFNPETEEYGGG